MFWLKMTSRRGSDHRLISFRLSDSSERKPSEKGVMWKQAFIFYCFLILTDAYGLAINGKTASRQWSVQRDVQSLTDLSAGGLELLEAASQPQSSKNRRIVEDLMASMEIAAKKKPASLKKPIAPGNYRTVWSTVTADSFFGSILRRKPSCVLGGPSWQLISKQMLTSENIVYWPFLDVRMAGLARLSPLEKNGGKNSKGYCLQISGLEFRWGADGCPEREDMLGAPSTTAGSRLRVFELDQDKTLSNGVGELELLFNDGAVRVTRDNIQKNTYVHLKEPFADDFLRFLN